MKEFLFGLLDYIVPAVIARLFRRRKLKGRTSFCLDSISTHENVVSMYFHIDIIPSEGTTAQDIAKIISSNPEILLKNGKMDSYSTSFTGSGDSADA